MTTRRSEEEVQPSVLERDRSDSAADALFSKGRRPAPPPKPAKPATPTKASTPPPPPPPVPPKEAAKAPTSKDTPLAGRARTTADVVKEVQAYTAQFKTQHDRREVFGALDETVWSLVRSFSQSFQHALDASMYEDLDMTTDELNFSRLSGMGCGLRTRL